MYASVEGVGDGGFPPSPPGVPPVQRDSESERERARESECEREEDKFVLTNSWEIRIVLSINRVGAIHAGEFLLLVGIWALRTSKDAWL